MGETFSPEYVKFASESEAIQTYKQKLGWQVGDYAILDSEDMPHIITHVMAGPQYFCVYLDETSWQKTSSLPYKRGEVPWKGYVMYPFSYSRWLPTLSDLLKMLVNHFRRTECLDMLICSEGAALGHLRDKVFNDYHKGSYGGGELELLAARLLERVLAGKEKK